MIVHDGQPLYEYQMWYLDGRQSFAMRVGDASSEEAAQYVIASYPKAKEYLYQQWGKRYIRQEPTITVEEILEPTAEWLMFEAKLELIKEKMAQFENKPNCKMAYDTAKKLYSRLKEEGEIYFKEPSSESYQQFKANCQMQINEAHKELDHHRGWSKILVNILAFVLTLGAGYAIAAVVNVALNKGRFTFFATDSSSKLNAVEDYIETMAVALSV